MPGLIRGVARTAVVAGTATAVSNRVSRRQAGRWAAQDQQRAYEQQAYPPPPVAPPPSGAAPADDRDNTIAQLQQLGDLKAQGILSEEEFQAQKRRILGA
jgi:hypothetical protein